VLTQAIGQVLPAAVGVALSPVPIIAVVLMLATPKARTNGPAFAIGWVLGLSVVGLVVVFATSAASDSSASTTADTVNWVQVGLGLLFLVMAARQWKGRPTPGEEAELPKWMAGLDTVTPSKAFGLGVLLSAVNPKNLALTLAAAASIAQAGLSDGDEFVAIMVFVALASVTVAGAVLFYVAVPAKATGPLTSVKEFMSEHNAVIMMVILLVLGAKLLGEGLAVAS